MIRNFLVCIVVFLGAVSVVGAQDVTLTEAQIDAAVAAAVPYAESVESLNVDLYTNTAVIDAVVTDADGTTTTVSITFVAGTDADGNVEWTVTAVSINGFFLRPAQLDALNETIHTSEAAEARDAYDVITDVTITEDEIQWDINDDLQDLERMTPERRGEPRLR